MSSSNPLRVALPDPPELLKDMLFGCTLMDDPVVAADGHTYNREQIELWLKQHDISPVTHAPLMHKMLVPNMAVRRLINSWRELHGHPVLVITRPVNPNADIKSSHRHRVTAQLHRARSPHETLPPTSSLHKRKRAIATLRLSSSECVTVLPSCSPRATFHLPPLINSSSRFVTTAWNLKYDIDNGHLASIADLAWLLLHGREGLPRDLSSAFKLALTGSCQGCPHSQGVLALCYTNRELYEEADITDVVIRRARRLANASAWAGSKYGHYALGCILELKEDMSGLDFNSLCDANSPSNIQYALAGKLHSE